LTERPYQKNFFICEPILDSYKDDIASMEHPVFSLSKRPDYRMLDYSYNGFNIKIKPSYTGLATIFDKDILLYLASCLMAAKNNTKPVCKTVRFSGYDYLVSTGKGFSGVRYRQIKEALERLKGTVIQTNIKTNNITVTEEFSLIDSWRVITEDEQGKTIAMEVTISDWFYHSILGNEMLTISPDYFKLKKPTDRRIYELARKHCGNQVSWKIKLVNLKEKIGSTSSIRRLRFNLNKLSESNHLPEYHVSIENDVVMFSRKESPKEHKIPKYVTKKEIEKHAKPGESKQQVIDRLKDLRNALKTSQR
jgi:plasmid replication initiation protein